MKKLYLLILIAGFCTYAFSQQEYQFTHYDFDRVSFNPGAAGFTNDHICATVIARQQWMGLKDELGDKIAPETYLLSVNFPIKKHGFGVSLINDQLGFEKTIVAKLSYSYRFKVWNDNWLGVGLQADFHNKQIDFLKFRPLVEDPMLQSKGIESDMITNMGFGAFFQGQGYFAGISSTQLLENQLTFNNTLAAPVLKRHYFVTGGYTFEFPDQRFMLDNSVLIKSDLASTQYDFNSRLIYMRTFVGGLNYRTTDALSVFAGVYNLAGVRYLGISYDITTSPLGAGQRSHGTFEIVLRYCFDLYFPDPKTGHGNIRGLPSFYQK